MKKISILIFTFIMLHAAFAVAAGGPPGAPPAKSTTLALDTSNFGGNLSGADTTLQAALDTIDDVALGGDTTETNQDDAWSILVDAESAFTLITVTYTDATDSITFTVENDLNLYDWTNVDGTDLKTGTVTQAYDAFLADIAGLSDPAANKLLGWDDTDNDIRFITLGTGLSYDAGTDTVSATGTTTIDGMTDTDLTGPAAQDLLVFNAAGTDWVDVSVGGDLTAVINGGAFEFTIASNSVALGDDTTGNYVATLADAGDAFFTIANSGAETAAVTIQIADKDWGDFSTSGQSATLDAGVVAAAELAATITLSDGDVVDFSGITHTNDTLEGLILPTWANVTVVGLTNGAIAWDEATDAIKVKSAAGWQSISPSGAPTDAEYIVATQDGSLTAERVMAWGTGLSASEAGDPVTLTAIFAPAELDDVTWGNNTTGTWTFDAGGVTDPTIAYANNSITLSILTVTGAITANGNITDGTATWNSTTQAFTGLASLDSTAITEGGNAVYNSTETPGGELGGTWASPTIDDSVTVTGWTLGTSSATQITVGALAGVNSIDATGAVDMDYGSADVTDHTFTTDGGTVIIDGSIIAAGEDLGSTSAEWGNLYVADDKDIAIGSGQEWTLNYDNSVDDQLLLSTAKTTAIADTDPMFEILVDTGNANGTGMDADQQVMGVSKGTQASNVPLMTLDEDGDIYFAGNLTLGGSFSGGDTTFNGLQTADGAAAVDIGSYEHVWTTSADPAGGGDVLTIKHSAAAITNNTYLLRLEHTADGDAQAHFMKAVDNNADTKFRIDYDGTVYGAAFSVFRTVDPMYSDWYEGNGEAGDNYHRLTAQAFTGDRTTTLPDYNAAWPASTTVGSAGAIIDFATTLPAVIGEDLSIALDAADEEISIAQSSATGTADTPLIAINDDRTGATADVIGEASIWIDAEGTYAIAAIDGAIYGETFVVSDTGTIGSASDLDAITIDATGNVTFSQNVVVSGTGIELNHATANTLTASGGVLSIEGSALIEVGDNIEGTAYIAGGIRQYKDGAADGDISALNDTASVGSDVDPLVLTAAELTGNTITNLGASGALYFLLPTAAMGFNAIFNMDVAQEIHLKFPAGNDEGYWKDYDDTEFALGATGKDIQCNATPTIGDRLFLQTRKVGATIEYFVWSDTNGCIIEP